MKMNAAHCPAGMIRTESIDDCVVEISSGLNWLTKISMKLQF